MSRDFTYIDDVVTGVVKVLDSPAKGDPSWTGKRPDPATSRAPYRIYNIGNNSPVGLMDFIEAIEKSLGRKAKKNLLPMQPGDVPVTWADVEDLVKDFGYTPGTLIQEGVDRFVKWYMEYYKQGAGSKDENEREKKVPKVS
jgi:UDP-glucuronate 4-epimerase